jgi:TonB family protein
MQPLPLALIVYSAQVLLIVGAASLAEAILRASVPTARLTYWRAVGALCLALPLLRTTSADLPAVSVAFAELPIESAAMTAVSPVLPAVGPAILWAWAGGAIAAVVWLLAGAWRVRQLRRESVPADMRPDIEALRTAIAPRAEFRWSCDLQQPVTLGIRQPVVLLPRRFDDLTDEARRAVACHELLHVARRDWLWIVLEAGVRALFWFHPAVWWLIDRVQLLREQVIDELVIAHTSSRREYMLALILFADGARPTALSSAFLRGRHLKCRLRQLSKEARMSVPRLAWTMIALTVVMAGVTAATVWALPLDLSAVAQDRAATRLEIRLAESGPAPGLSEAVVPGSGQRIYLHAMTLATADDVTSARVIEGAGPSFSVSVTFSGAASARIASGTGAHLGRPLAIVLDGQVISVVTVKAQIGDSAVISGPFDAASAQALAARLAPVPPVQKGATRDGIVLPVPIHQERPQYTGAAMAAQIEGTVLLETVVLADGSVGDVRIIKPFDSQYGLDQEAVNALKLWTWKPGTQDGKPARVAVHVEMTFTLK